MAGLSKETAVLTGIMECWLQETVCKFVGLITLLYRCLLLGLVLVTWTGGCESPQETKVRHLERGDEYFSQAQYQAAVSEYRNALRLHETDTHAIQRLGLAYYHLGELGQSFPLLLKTKELAPDNLDVRLKLGAIYLVTRKLEEAREEVTYVLERAPSRLEALLLWAGTAHTPEEVDEAIARLETMQAVFAEQTRFHFALGTLYLHKRDLDNAERSFQTAVEKEPRSIEAHSLLGNFYLAKRDSAKAEREFQALAQIVPVGSPERIALADLYFLLQKPAEAKQVLAEITTAAPDFLPAWRRIAELAFREQRYDESLTATDMIFEKNPGDLDGHLLRGQVYLAQHKTVAAITQFQQVLRGTPESAPAHYQLALAQLQAGNLEWAKESLLEAKTIIPDYIDAILLLAELSIQTGATQAAIEDLENLIEQRPRLTPAYRLLGAAYLADKKPVRATEIYRQFLLLAPQDPQGKHGLGVGLRAQGKTVEARQAFQEAVELAPGFVPPLTQLVALDFAEKRLDAALERIQKQTALAPESAELQILLGRVYLARREGEPAEAAFLKAIALNPQAFAAYVALGEQYARTQRYDEALEKLEQALSVNPKDLGVQMLIGMVHEQRGTLPEAQARYEAVLALNPRFGPAANNLAYLYSEHGSDNEKSLALALAQTAKEALPKDPRVSDTLGWILYKRGIYRSALQLLRESAAKLADTPEIHYHLGMTHYRLGKTEEAKKALAKALKLNAQFPGVEKARHTLAEIE